MNHIMIDDNYQKNGNNQKNYYHDCSGIHFYHGRGNDQLSYDWIKKMDSKDSGSNDQLFRNTNRGPDDNWLLDQNNVWNNENIRHYNKHHANICVELEHLLRDGFDTWDVLTVFGWRIGDGEKSCWNDNIPSNGNNEEEKIENRLFCFVRDHWNVFNFNEKKNENEFKILTEIYKETFCNSHNKNKKTWLNSKKTYIESFLLPWFRKRIYI